jgi:hypothetical protein
MEPKIIADLHNHSSASDGELSPAAVGKLAAAEGFSAISITDHDTLAGVKEGLAAGIKAGIEVIPGVELTLRLKRPEFVGSLHLLIYFQPVLLKNPDFINTIQALFAAGRGPALVRDRVAAINHYFGPNSPQATSGTSLTLKKDLTTAEIEKLGDNITRRHFARVLSENHQLDPAQVKTIIANQSPVYLPSGIDPEKLYPLRRKFPLLIFLAHPAAGSFPPPSHYREVLPPWPTVKKLLPEFMAPEPIQIDGLEIEYPGHREVDKQELKMLAAEFNLLAGGGSDGHDLIERPYTVSGIGQKDFARFKQHYEALR